MFSLAEKKFWRCPELLEKMLLSLDYDSLKSLAEAHQPVNSVLGKTLWALLIKQVTTMEGYLIHNQIRDLGEILKSKEGPLYVLRDLLKGMCTRFPADPEEASSDYVRVSCPWEESGSVCVSLQGFKLLEIAEGALGSTEQHLELAVVNKLWTWRDQSSTLSSLASRLLRQRDKGVESKIIIRNEIDLLDISEVSSFSSMMQNCQAVDLQFLSLTFVDIEEEGWTMIKEALSRHALACLEICFKQSVATARREDLRAIWECVTDSWEFYHESFNWWVTRSRGTLVFEKKRGAEAEGLAALERFLDLTAAEWATRRAKARSVRCSNFFVNGQQVVEENVWYDEGPTPFDHLSAELVVFELEGAQVELQMLEPGWPGLKRAFQHAVLFHPAFGPGGDQEQEQEVDQQENANGASYQAEVEEEEGHKHETQTDNNKGCVLG